MSPILIIVIAVFIAIGVGVALFKKRPPALPSDGGDEATGSKTATEKTATEKTATEKTATEKTATEKTATEKPKPAPAKERAGALPKDVEPAKAQAPAADKAKPESADDDVQVEEAPVAEPAEIAPKAAAAEAAPAGVPSEEEVAALKKGLASTRGGFISRLARLFGGKREIDPALLDEVEEVLITADIGVHTTQRILTTLRERLKKNELADADMVWAAIQAEAQQILERPPIAAAKGGKPRVILVVGVNGVGKTTTIGKLAQRFTSEGQNVLLAAGDTFRAAAVLQLEVWGRRTGATVIKGKDRADPGSVIFDAIKRAQDEDFDLVIADTAGRLHTKTPLMDELQKIGRTLEKALGRPADETLLVLDATTGQNAIQQTELFKQALPLSGIVLTKLDGSAKGGVVLGIVDQHELPIQYLGVGERVEDLREFDAPSFAAALFERPEDDQSSS